MNTQKIKKIKVENLNLWTENPRDPVDPNFTDYEIIKKAITDDSKKWNLRKLIQEMGDYYDLSELPTVVKIKGEYVIYDGNRRIAVLKYLQNKELYQSLGGGLFPELEPEELRGLKEIPCNVCDIETALINIERKHINSGSWGPIEREYFLHKHRGQDKSLFLKFEEQTSDSISENSKMNKRFVKEEVLTEKNLNDIGFAVDDNGNLVSNYSDDVAKDVVDGIIFIISKDKISTRKNRGKLKETLLSEKSELKNKIQEFNNKEKKAKLNIETEKSEKKQRKTNITQINDQIFGKSLTLREGKVNDLYSAIAIIYEQNKKNRKKLRIILPITGMSLRLILDVAAREYYKNKGEEKLKEDQVYKSFLKIAKKELKNQEDINYLSLTNDWLSDKFNIDGILAKYAHGNINTSNDDILKMSAVIADILELYFKK